MKYLTKTISKVLKFLLRRMVIVAGSIILQIFWIIAIANSVGMRYEFLNYFLQLVSIVVVVYIVNKEENPAYKLAWVIPILIFPIFGGVLYIMLGNKQPSKNLRIKVEQSIDDMDFLLVQDEKIMEDFTKKSPMAANQSAYINDYGGYPIYQNSSAKYYSSGESMFEDLIVELKNAKHYIFMEFFIVAEGYMWDTILDILKERVDSGVEVRFMYDDVGCVDLLPYKYYKKLEKVGIQAIPFNPIIPFVSTAWNNRDHRKVVVIDGHMAFTGGLNLADEYINRIERFGYWKDAGLQVVGDAVWNFTVMFLQVWNALRPTDIGFGAFVPHGYYKPEFIDDGFIQPFADNPLDRETVGENVYLNIINAAVEYVYIYTPYLVIDNEMMTALCLAAKRGVNVRIVTPSIPDKKTVFLLTQSYYHQLVEAGVYIYEYSPGFIHSKCFLSDDKVGVVGTINCDFRSLYLHFENGVFMYECEALKELKADFLDTFEKSERITHEKCEPSVPKALAQSVLRVLAPLV